VLQKKEKIKIFKSPVQTKAAAAQNALQRNNEAEMEDQTDEDSRATLTNRDLVYMNGAGAVAGSSLLNHTHNASDEEEGAMSKRRMGQNRYFAKGLADQDYILDDRVLMMDEEETVLGSFTQRHEVKSPRKRSSPSKKNFLDQEKSQSPVLDNHKSTTISTT